MRTSSKTFRGLIRILSILILVWGGVAGPPARAGDFLRQPAFRLARPDRAALMDVTRAGSRLVAVGERGVVVYSDDGGRTWTQASVPVRATLTAVHFPAPETGWAVGHESVLLRSRDGGETWEKVLDGRQINDQMVRAMQTLVDRIRRRLETASEEERPAVQSRLEDAEVNLKGFEETREEGPVQPLLDIAFGDRREGLVVGAFGIITATSDGGDTWTPLLDGIENPMGYHFYGLARTRDREFLFGEAGGAYRSSDGGQRWEKLDTPYQGSFFGALADPAGDMVAGFGLRGNLVLSYDDGATWRHERIGQGAALTGGTVLSDRRFVVVGMAGEIYLGSTLRPGLRPLKTGFPACMAAAEAPDGGLVLVGLRGVHRMEPGSIRNEEMN